MAEQAFVRPLVLLLLAACSSSSHKGVTAGELEVHGGFAFAPPTTSEGAAYFTVVNTGATADTLRTITSPIAASAMLHASQQRGGMVQMQGMDEAVIGPRDSLVLAPGGIHLMLVELSRKPVPGDTIAVTLTFARAGTVTLPLPVRSYSDAP